MDGARGAREKNLTLSRNVRVQPCIHGDSSPEAGAVHHIISGRVQMQQEYLTRSPRQRSRRDPFARDPVPSFAPLRMVAKTQH
jgi:hypothetical protein